MAIDADEIIEINRRLGGGGKFQKRREPSFRSMIQGRADTHIVNLCYVAAMITCNQYFSDCNHRTGMATLYLKMIDDLDIVTRRKPYQIYGRLDTMFYHYQYGRDIGLQAFTDEIGMANAATAEGGGFQRLNTEFLKERERNRIMTEIAALPALLRKITAPPQSPGAGKWDKEKQAAMKIANAEYRQLKSLRKKFKEYNGGSLLHSSER